MKYHIFIGSTLDDLKNERKGIIKIIMELGHIPIMADYLDLTDKNGEQLLQKTIEECDYFIALAAHKIPPLEAEYNIAAKKNIPVIALVIDEKARWKSSKKETEPELVAKMEEFKNKLRSGACETWLNSTDLCQKCQNLLIMEMNLRPQSGWIKADQATLPSVANELSRLSAENEHLRQHVNFDNGELIAKLRDQMKQTIRVLALNEITLSFYYSTGESWENPRQFRHIRLFKLLAPELMLGKTTAEISRFLGTVLNPDLDKAVRKDYPTPSNTIKKIMADFSLLKLVKCVNGNESSGNEVWEITEYGKELFSIYRMRQLEKGYPRKG